jgi:hypothetical protein
MRLYPLLAMVLGGSFIGSSCGGQGIGDPCIPEEEYLTDFPGFNVGEVNVESRSFQCLTRVCLVNHFQGRVSCPYGQLPPTAGDPVTGADCADPPNANKCNYPSIEHEQSCRLPFRDGTAIEDRVKVEIDPQFVDRTAADAVYCSCRCSGPNGTKDPKARYCDCPSGYSCQDIFADLGEVASGKGQLAGGYCVRDGTAYNAATPPVVKCTSTSSADTCGYYKTVDGKHIGVNPPNKDIDPASIR